MDLAKGEFVWIFGNYDQKRLKRKNYIDTCLLIRRDLFCGFDPQIKRLQDWDLWLTLMEHGVKGLHVKKTGFLSFRLDVGITSITNSYTDAYNAI